MTVLSTPTLVNQLLAGGAYPHADCGEACARSTLIDAGHNDLIGQIERTIGGNLANGTNIDELAHAMTSLGVPASPIAEAGEFDAALARRHRIIVEIPSDHYGNPDPGSVLGHFVLGFGFDGTNYHVMNPLGGRVQLIAPSTLIECERDRGFRAVEIDEIMPADRGDLPAAQPSRPAPAQGVNREAFTVTIQRDVTAGANVRALPSNAPGVRVLETLNPGVQLHCTGWAYGPAVWDAEAHQLDRRWYQLAMGGWMASALVDGNAPNSRP